MQDGDHYAASCGPEEGGHRPLEGEISIKESDGTYNVWCGALAAGEGARQQKKEKKRESKGVQLRWVEQ
jgi:hypothetical protein